MEPIGTLYEVEEWEESLWKDGGYVTLFDARRLRFENAAEIYDALKARGRRVRVVRVERSVVADVNWRVG